MREGDVRGMRRRGATVQSEQNPAWCSGAVVLMPERVDEALLPPRARSREPGSNSYSVQRSEQQVPWFRRSAGRRFLGRKRCKQRLLLLQRVVCNVPVPGCFARPGVVAVGLGGRWGDGERMMVKVEEGEARNGRWYAECTVGES